MPETKISRADTSTSSKPPSADPHAAFGKIGVLLVNLGTPDATDYWSMRRYLKEFLSDRRVVETSRLIWWPVLNLMVLTSRPKRSGAAYDLIWNRERDESPLRTITRSQSDALASRITGEDSPLVVDWAMRYGNPSIASRLDRLVAEGCDRILVFPLYPQYASATTASVNDKVFDALAKMRHQPAIRTVPPYPDDPVYIDALAVSLKQHLSELSFEPEVVIASFHGLPKEYVEKGDPYYDQSVRTAQRLREALGWDERKLMLTFQSRMGRAEWLKPHTDETVKQLARDGVKRIAVITPGFVADCVETLEEIAGQNREFFLEHGGEQFAAIPCLNDSDEGMKVIEAVVARELAGWI